MLSSILILPLAASLVFAYPQNRRVVRRGGNSATSVPAVWNNAVEMLTPVTIAGVTYNVVLDTGSDDFWLFCTEGNDAMDMNRTVYDPSTGTKLEPKSQFDVEYGSGYAKGTVYKDKVTLGNITVDQYIGCATAVDNQDVGDRNLDGLIGLGFNSGSKTVYNGISQNALATKNAMNTVTTLGGGFLGLFKSQKPNPQRTFTENAFSQMQSGFFTVDIGSNNTNGTFTFGNMNAARFSTTLTYMPVRDWNQWIVESSGYQVGNSTLVTKVSKALIDTGTTNILLSMDMATAYYAAVPKATTTGDGNWLVPCDLASSSMQDLKIQFTPPALIPNLVPGPNFPAGSGGVKRDPYSAVVSAKFLIGGVSDANNGTCRGAIQGQKGSKSWDLILGDAFLMSQLVVFDLGNVNGVTDKNMPTRGQIGFAPKPQ